MSSNKLPLCSVCCVSYNHADFIEPAIKSIWEQDYKNVEIVVLDDCSTDSSQTILKNLQEQSPVPMKLILNEKNCYNVGANYNETVKNSDGEFITFLSLDDMLFKDALSFKIDKMAQNNKIAFIANSQITKINENAEIIKPVEHSPLEEFKEPNANDLLNLEHDRCHTFYIQGTLFRKDIIDSIGGFDEDMLGDDIILRSKVFKYIIDNPDFTFEIHQKPCFYYRSHSTNISKNYVRQIKLILQYFERYHKGKQLSPPFVNYFYYVMKESRFKQIWEMLNYNNTMKCLLHKPKIWRKLIWKYISEKFRS